MVGHRDGLVPLDETADGECEKRKLVQCALDAYLLPIIDAIEESTGKTFDRAEAVKSPNPVLPGWVISPHGAR